MSRDIQLASVGGLPIRAEDAWAQQHSTALGPAASAQQAPLKKIHQKMRGRYAVAIIAGLVLGLIGAFFGFKSTKPLYASYGFVEIRPVINNPVGGDRVIAMYTAYVQTQAKTLSQQRVLQGAMDSEAWKQTGRGGFSDDESLRTFQESLLVGPLKNSYYIQIQFLDEDPAVAQTAVNALLSAYEPIVKEEGIGANERNISYLEDEIVKHTAEIEAKTREVRALAQEYQMDDLAPLFEAQLAEMVNMERMYTQASVARTLAEVAMQKNRDGQGVDAAALSPEQIAQQDRGMAKLLERRDEFQFQIDELRLKGIGENHRNMQNARINLKLCEDQIQRRAEEFRRQYATLQTAPDGNGGVTLLSIDELKAREETLRSIFETQREKVMKIGQSHLKIKQLKEDIDKLRETNEEYNERIKRYIVEASIGGTMTIYKAERPVSFAVDKRKQFAVAGFVGGMGLPFAVFLLIGLLDSRYRYSEEAGTDMSGIHLLGILPNLPDLLTDPEQAAIAAHCVHQIRTMLQINGGMEEKRVFAVTSASPGDGKTSLTLALGLSFAASGSRTLIIDCDLVGAGLTTRMNLASDEGVLEAIANRALLQYIRTTEISDLAILPVGSAQAHHASLLSPAAMRRLVAEAKKHFETILIDTGPILGSIEASSVVAAADGVILCVARGQQRPLVEKSLGHLSSIGARLAGVVFNRAQARDFDRSVSRMSMRSVSRPSGNGHVNNENGALAPANGFGPVARAVASSVKTTAGGHE